MNAILFNVNERVSIQLTDMGRKELDRRHIEPHKEDDHGWSKWQLWDIMRLFGGVLEEGDSVPFKTMVKVGPYCHRGLVHRDLIHYKQEEY